VPVPSPVRRFRVRGQLPGGAGPGGRRRGDRAAHRGHASPRGDAGRRRGAGARPPRRREGARRAHEAGGSGAERRGARGTVRPWSSRIEWSCRRARGSWRTPIRRASSRRPSTRHRRCSRRWPSLREGPEVYCRLVFKLLSTTGEQAIDLVPGRTIVVGRAVTSDVPIYDPTISRKHAELILTDCGVKVKDAGSSNGTFLNGARVTEALAGENDVITFGKVAFRVK